MTPFSLSANWFDYYSALFHLLLLEQSFHRISFVMLLFRMTRSDVRAALDVVRKNRRTGCSRLVLRF